MTDREKLIACLKHCAGDGECTKCDRWSLNIGIECVNDLLLSAAIALEEKQATSDNNKQWIPVAERLPDIPDGWAEHPDPVLYMMKSTEMIYAGYYGENGIYRDKYFREYHDRHEGVDADDVLCWMWQHDLPEAPKEVE